MKTLLVVTTVVAMILPAHSAEEVNDSNTVAELRAEITRLKTELVKAKEETVTYFSCSVALRSKFDSAVQRIHEANEVATQWRAQANTLQKDLAYTKALFRQKTYAESPSSSAVNPEFRVSNILRQPNIISPRDGVAPTYIAIR